MTDAKEDPRYLQAINEPWGVFEEEISGVKTLRVRAQQDATWCGYIVVPEGHPWYKLSESKIEWPPWCEIHGGITLCGPGIVVYHEHEWWLGFDCAHAWDYLPTLANIEGIQLPEAEFRDGWYVRRNVLSMVHALRAAAGHPVRFAVWQWSDQTITYLDAEDECTTKHPEAKLWDDYDAVTDHLVKFNAEMDARNKDNPHYDPRRCHVEIEIVTDEAEFRAREDTW